MNRNRHCIYLLISLLLFVLFLAGCSSLPKEAVQKTPENLRADSFLELGHRQLRSGKSSQAITSFNRALAGHAAVDERAGVSKSLCGLGRAQMAQGNLEEARTCFTQALHSSGDLDKPELEAQALGGLGAVELHLQQPHSALSFLETALALPLENPGSTRATLLHDLGSAQLKQGDSSAAEISFLEALAMHEILRDLVGIASDCYSLAIFHDAAGNTQLAIEKAKRALNNDKRAGNSPGVALDLTLLASLSESGGDKTQAIDYYRRARLAWQALGQNDKFLDVSQRLQRIESS